MAYDVIPKCKHLNKFIADAFQKNNTHLWWWILYVNLSEPQDAQMSGEALFLGVPVGVFLEGISTWMVDWVEPIAIPSVFGYHSIHLGLKTKKKKKR